VSNENRTPENAERRKESRPHPRVLIDDRILPRRFLVVSNRLPYRLSLAKGHVVYERGVGGLVTALDPILRLTGGTWIGWTGGYEPLPEKILIDQDEDLARGYHLRPINLTWEEVEQYYLGYSNKSLWPLFHYFQELCQFNREQWDTYVEVNQSFAEAIIGEYQDGDLIWIHDYHLMLTPAMVREQIPNATIGFFLHIPFPNEEIYLLEPHAEELLRGLLGADVVGFHVDSYAYNFLNSVSALTEHRFERGEREVHVDSRRVKVGSYPISIDFEQFAGLAAREDLPEKVAELRDFYSAEIVALGVDRLDYSKGILERLQAVEVMLDQHPEIQGKFTFVQLSAPSRTKVHAYQAMREKVEGMVGRINGRFGGRGCIPIDYRYESHSQEDLVAYYRAADLALVTPLRDGMNLVAKEYVASQLDDSGLLVLSRFAGAYDELRDAVIVNPYDIEGMAERIHDALQLTVDQRRRRMRRMRDVVRRNDIYWWLERFLRDMVPPRYRMRAAAGTHQARMDWSPVAPSPRVDS
jgi:alpha,alpha-trehalose-phosphate synthase [UDP-forming]